MLGSEKRCRKLWGETDVVKACQDQEKPVIFNSLFGLTVPQFDRILLRLTPKWEKEILGEYLGPGRPFDHTLEDMVLMLLLYYRSYITQEFVGYLFDLDKSRVCRIIQKLEPLLAHVISIPKRKQLSKKRAQLILLFGCYLIPIP